MVKQVAFTEDEWKEMRVTLHDLLYTVDKFIEPSYISSEIHRRVGRVEDILKGEKDEDY